MATIETRTRNDGSISYRVAWRCNGRKGSQSLTVADVKAANDVKTLVDAHGRKLTRDEAAAIILKRDGADELTEVSSAPLFGEFAWAWLDERAVDLADGTYKDYRSKLRTHIAPAFGSYRLDAITPELIVGWKSDLCKKLSARNVTNHLRLLHAILSGAEAKHGTANVARGVRGPKIPNGQQVFLTVSEFNLVHAQCHEAIRDLVYVAVHTGARIGELCSLRVGDVVPGAIILTHATKTRASRRSITITPTVEKRLAALTAGRPSTAPLFAAPGGGFWKTANVRTRWNRAVVGAMRCSKHPAVRQRKPSGKTETAVEAVSACECVTRLHQRPRFHDLRHTHVAWLADLGWHIDEVQRRLGHTRLQTTSDVYWHRFQRPDTARMAALDDYAAAA